MIRNALGRLLRPAESGGNALSYMEAKQLAKSGDPEQRRQVALDPETRPELLYFLARDVSPAVRAAVAAHPATPRQADLILATDDMAEVRTLIAEKVTGQVHTIPHDDAAQLWQLTISILEALMRDDLTRVRQLVAESVRGLDRIPRTVAITLARDKEADVAIPALGYPGGFADEELVEIVRGAHDARIVSAIAARPRLGAAVSQAVVERGDEAPIAALLANHTAEIAPETFAMVSARADKVPAWQAPLAARPVLDDRNARQVASDLQASLRGRSAPPPIGAKLHDRVTKGAASPVLTGEVIEPVDDTASRVRKLDREQALSEDMVIDALTSDQAFAEEALALRARLPVMVTRKIFRSSSAKGLVALAWRAGYSMRLGLQLQTRIGRLPPKTRLTSTADTWPLSPDEMSWQIEFFRTLVPTE